MATNTNAQPANGNRARRILIYGVTGSGTTTLARRIGEASGLPWHEPDTDMLGKVPDIRGTDTL